MENVTAKLRFLKMTPRKVRLVADLVRGKQVDVACNALKVLNKRAAKPILKLIDSASANAKHNFSLKEEGLKIETITVDDGPTAKRWMPRAMGRATTIRKRTSHVKIVLTGEVDEKVKKATEAKAKKAEEKAKKTETKKTDVKDVTDIKKAVKEVKQVEAKPITPKVANVSKPRKMGSRSK